MKATLETFSTTVRAHLDIEMLVNCPHCDYLIDLLNEGDTNRYCHNDDGYLIRQMFPKNSTHEDFECEDITCGICKKKFNVRGLEW